MCSHIFLFDGCKGKDFFISAKTFNSFFFSFLAFSFIYINYKGVKPAHCWTHFLIRGVKTLSGTIVIGLPSCGQR